ncbi:MAG: AAA family ATPase [Sneathiella sp.]
MTNRQSPEIVTFPVTGSPAVSAAAFVADRETERQLKDLLSKWGYDRARITRGSVQDAIREYETKSMPEVLIVDISNTPLPLSDLQGLADISPPRVNVVVLGTRDNVGLYRDLIDIGVTDYLVKPVPSDLLYKAVARASGQGAARGADPRTGKTIAVYGVRGGVGATTTVFNTGWLLANVHNRHVVLADLNLKSGSLALEMGLEPSSGLAELLTNPDRIDNVFVDRAILDGEEKLKLLASVCDLASMQDYDEVAVSALMQHLRSRFHFIIQDVDRGQPAVAMKVLRSADVRVLVLDPTLAAVRDVARILKRLDTEADSHKTLVVLNRARSGGSDDIPLDNISRFIDHPVDIIIPFDRKKLALASLNGAPVARRKSPVTNAYLRLAGELVGQKEPARRLGWLSSLMGG